MANPALCAAPINPSSAEARAIIEAEPWDHPVFATVRIPNVTWERLGVEFTASDDVVAQLAESGIDALAEMQAGARRFLIGSMEEKFLDSIRARYETDITDVEAMLAFVIERAPDNANTLIINSNFWGDACRIIEDAPARDTAVPHRPYCDGYFELAGSITDPNSGRRFRVVRNNAENRNALYAGYVPERQEDRKFALVRTGVANFEYGMAPNFANDWIAINT